MADEFLEERIKRVKAQIESTEDAIDKLTSGAVQSYSIDTGQTRQSVTKIDLDMLHRRLDSLMNRYFMLKARCDGGSSFNAGSAW